MYALDMFHMVSEKQELLNEFRRMLGNKGTLILEDGHNPRSITLQAVQEHGDWQVIAENARYITCTPK